MENNKEVYINAKNTSRGVTKTGKNFMTLSFTNEEFQRLVDTASATATERGVKLMVISKEAQTKDGSRTFESSSVVVSGIQEYKGNQAPKGRFVPKGAAPQNNATAQKAGSFFNKKPVE